MKNLNEKSKKAVAAVIFTVCLCVLSAIAVTTITIPHAKKYAAAIALYNSLRLIRKEYAFLQLTQKHGAQLHTQFYNIYSQATNTLVGAGGCGRPAGIRLMPPMSTMTEASSNLVTVSTMIMSVFAPLCGSKKPCRKNAWQKRKIASSKLHTVTATIIYHVKRFLLLKKQCPVLKKQADGKMLTKRSKSAEKKLRF